ncbi:Bromodomain containing protein 7 [Desmophyllum pertusum]|uniref:Bromodomain containing protein 7 n=1 Tax=Desmophyllum pertusum TaxID=174260 RepID=A0A9X0CFA8_9CNID|nr:Bromodomain containing protein 7 [Desmophyllum pertusum]
MGKKHKSKKHHKKGTDVAEEKPVRSEKAEKVEKPIKLVLKVGSNQEKVTAKPDSRSSTPSRPSLNPDKTKSKDHSSKKKKKKRSSSKERKKPKFDPGSSVCASPSSISSHGRSKRKRDRQEMEGESSSVIDAERPIKKIYIKPIEPPNRNSPESRKVGGYLRQPEISPLQLCLENIHLTLQRKDTQGFFAYPSSFRDDFYLMCNNAMVYNAPETIYYKAAKRIIQTGSKMLSPEKIRNMYRSIGYTIPEYEGHESEGRGSDEPIDVDTIDTEENHVPQTTKRTKPRSESKHTSASRKILAQVQAASRRMAAELEAKHPNSKIGFLRRDKDGTTSLAVVNPVDSEAPEYLHVSLGAAVGKVTTGSHTTAGFKEDKRNKATPVSYLMYGPYGSFAPSYDSSKATITKEQSDLLYSTYGDDTGIHYAKSLQAFVKDASSFSHEAVDRLLDVLTEGAHSKYVKQMAEKEKAEEEKQAKDNIEQKMEVLATERESSQDASKTATATGTNEKSKVSLAAASTAPNSSSTGDATKIDIQSLLSLADEGIDVSFLKSSDDTSSSGSLSSLLSDKLHATGKLLDDLQEVQIARLSHRPDGPGGPTPEAVIRPSSQEKSIADRVTENLKDLTSQAYPEDVTSINSIRAAIGVGLVPNLLSGQRQKPEEKTAKEKTGPDPVESAEKSMETADSTLQASAEQS